jgi:hypothetical protein
MANLTCPKCGGSDYFLSKRNIVKGMGWAQRGSLKSVPVCRVCDEIMDGAQVGMSSWEDLGRASKYPAYKPVKIDYFVYAILMVSIVISLIWSNPITVVLMWLGIIVFGIRLVQIVKIRKSKK